MHGGGSVVAVGNDGFPGVIQLLIHPTSVNLECHVTGRPTDLVCVLES